MRISFDPDLQEKVEFLTGDAQNIEALPTVSSRKPFDKDTIEFLDEVSHELMKNIEAKSYSDVITFAFWIRKASVLKLKDRFAQEAGKVCLGKGVAFHIAPSNVPVNFAYSLAVGLIMGNANIVRVPSKDFPQVKIITGVFCNVLAKHKGLETYVLCVRYDHDKAINDLFSSLCDIRIIWGGDQTIGELRKSPLPPRSGEITFADRYSIAVIDADVYLGIENKDKIAEDFYNDTFFSDQNACTSPRMVIWTGNRIEEAKSVFWKLEDELAKKKYTFQSIQAVNKLSTSFLAAASLPGLRIVDHEDNLLIRVRVSNLTDNQMDYRENSG